MAARGTAQTDPIPGLPADIAWRPLDRRRDLAGMNAEGRLLRNAGALVSSQAISKLLNLAVSVALVRWLGPNELGRYTYILAFCFPFGAVADFGLSTLAIREISRNSERDGIVVHTLRRLLLGLALLSLAAATSLALALREQGSTVLGIVLGGSSSLISALSTPHLILLTAREKLHLVSLFRIIASAVGSIVTLGVLLLGGKSIALLLGAAGVNCAMFLVAQRITGLLGPTPRISWSVLAATLRQAVPFGLLMIGYALYYRVDMLLLNWLQGDQAVGVYAAAYRFLDAVMMLAASIGGPLFPRLSRLIGQDTAQAQRLIQDVWRFLVGLGLPLTVGTILVADRLIVVLFGPSFIASGPVLQVLISSTLPLLWLSIGNHALIAADRVGTLAALYWAGAVLNAGGNLLLIPALGVLGASLTTVGCEWIIVALVVWLVRRQFRVALPGEGIWRTGLAVCAMVGGLWAASGAPLGIQIVLAGLAYAGALILLGYHRSPEAVALRRLLSQ
jgi:O-antigen/teichoic acid export membrane protein